MSYLRWLAVILALSLIIAEVQAQAIIVGNYSRRSLSISFALGNGYLPGYPGFLGPGAPYGYATVSQSVVIQGPPAVVVVPRSRFRALDDFDLEPEPGPLTRRRVPPPPPREPEPLPLPPERKPNEEKKPEKKPEKVPEPMPKPDDKPVKPPELRPPPMPRDDPAEEHDRLVNLGKEAFEAQEYGRARERFQAAIRLTPNQPQAYFLLAQTLIVLGKYHEAVATIHDGLALKPDWPTAPFRPLDLYGDNVVDYADHLARLEATLTQHPADSVLLFLYAYQLWFDGRKDEARPLFHRALARGADRGDVERFLKALPAEDL
jgi:tetratricopeptide (TPR) repeat protein